MRLHPGILPELTRNQRKQADLALLDLKTPIQLFWNTTVSPRAPLIKICPEEHNADESLPIVSNAKLFCGTQIPCLSIEPSNSISFRQTSSPCRSASSLQNAFLDSNQLIWVWFRIFLKIFLGALKLQKSLEPCVVTRQAGKRQTKSQLYRGRQKYKIFWRAKLLFTEKAELCASTLQKVVLSICLLLANSF